MIERFSIAATSSQLATRFEVEEPASFHARYNISPAQLIPVITAHDKRGFSFFYWGQPPSRAKNNSVAEKLINVRVESIAEKPMLKKNLIRNRCIIPLDGFYTWKKAGKKTFIPWRFGTEGNLLLSMPAMWEEYDDADGNPVHTFMIITIAAVRPVDEITDRMPVLFTKSEEANWLSANATEQELLNLLHIHPVSLVGHAVSHQLNDSSFDRPSLILPTQPADQFGNLTLFD